MWAISTVLNGTADIRMAARPLSMRVSPQLISTKGSMVPINPMASSGSQSRRNAQSLCPWARATAAMTTAPMAIRSVATDVGGMSATAILISRKDPPQIAPSENSRR
jgi:hypothetical protein